MSDSRLEADEFVSVGHRVYRQVNENPDAVALVGPDGDRHDYPELWRRALGWRARLTPLLSGREPIVAVLRPNDMDVPAAQLGAWLCDAAYLPIDQRTPDGRLAEILADSGCSVVVTTEDLADRLPGDVRAVTTPGQPDPNITLPRWRPDSLAYVIYTSGSTGRPKGVEVEHGSLAHLLDWFCPLFDLRPGVSAAMFCGLGFDASVLDIWAPLAAGARLHIPGDSVAHNIELVADFLDDREVGHCCLPTPLAEQLFASGLRPRSLRTLYIGGDRLRVWPAEDFPAEVRNMYGPTEATIATTSTTDLRTHPGRTSDGMPPIGRPAGAARVLLVGDEGDISSPGTPGELYIGGPLLARGYRHDPELTAESFVRLDDGERWYRSGDICSWTPDGELEFVGRQDGQVKIRGYRIDIGEIEQTLLRCRGVRQTAVLPIDRAGGRALACWLEGEVDLDEVRAALADRLPSYMIPGQFTVLDSLPLTANGKIDRTALVESASAGTGGARPVLRTATEEIVAGVWEAHLGESPARDSDFFELGGHSLLAYQVTTRLKPIFDVDLRIALLFENPVLCEFSSAIDDLLRLAKGAAHQPLVTTASPGSQG